ncbi:uncharacterized protein LOC110038136 [Phalaenopsis equestris]|uniref:uncharacterized protein LOC110038136 n=1 Tax=Phalaenopsis equestris TaxID=78828 RepID=UPI0009E35F68|nr:uncharacterized protein LOC110038136 [Phalaenopsis equestris]
MKIFKWSTDFDTGKELPIVPIWLKLSGLKLHFFNHKVLFNIREALGKPLKLDVPTFNLSRPSVARILVERDLTLPTVDEIWLGTEHNGYWQKIIAEQKPYYCFHCFMFGHTDNKCFKLHPRLRIDHHAASKDAAMSERERDISDKCLGETIFERNVHGPDETILVTKAAVAIETEKVDNQLNIDCPDHYLLNVTKNLPKEAIGPSICHLEPSAKQIITSEENAPTTSDQEPLNSQLEVGEVVQKDFPVDSTLVEVLQTALADDWQTQKARKQKKTIQELNNVKGGTYLLRDRNIHLETKEAMANSRRRGKSISFG